MRLGTAMPFTISGSTRGQLRTVKFLQWLGFMASTFRDLTQLCQSLVARGIEVVPTTERSYYGHGHFAKVTLHARSIVLLCNAWTEGKEQTDVGAICVLSRCIIEVRNALAYLLEHNISPNEAHLRLHLVALNHSVDLLRVNKGLDTGKDMFWHEHGVQHSRKELESNPVFNSLDAVHKKNLLRGKSPFQQLRYKGIRPLSTTHESAIYTLLSHSVHSFSLGLTASFGHGTASPSGAVNSFLIATRAAQIYLADSARIYCRFRRRAIGKLSEQEANCIHESLDPAPLVTILRSIRAGASL